MCVDVDIDVGLSAIEHLVDDVRLGDALEKALFCFLAHHDADARHDAHDCLRQLLINDENIANLVCV